MPPPGVRDCQRRYLRLCHHLLATIQAVETPTWSTLPPPFTPGVDIAALSLPRGNGKSWLAAYILARCLTPGDDLHQPGKEYLLLAATLEQARIAFRFVRGRLGEGKEYRWTDSTQRIGAVHLPTNTRLRVISSDGRGAMGIVDVPLIVADEPGAWSANSLMADALETALGKPGSPLKIIYIGTVAPAKSGWWHEMIDDGSHDSIYVQALQGDRAKWDQASEIRRVNPLMWTYTRLARMATLTRSRFFDARKGLVAKACIRQLPPNNHQLTGYDDGWAIDQTVWRERTGYPQGKSPESGTHESGFRDG